MREFGSKIKVARKSHIKKDAQAVGSPDLSPPKF
jgi:hypothetical protein